MKLLLDERNLIVAISNNIQYGVWGNVGECKSWKITETHYMMDNGYHLVDIDNQEIPTYVKPHQYYYIDTEFKLVDECPNEYKAKIEQLESALTMSNKNLLDTQLALTEQYEANITLEETILSMKNEIESLKNLI